MRAAGPFASHLPALAGCLAGGLLCLRLWQCLPFGARRGSARELAAGEESGTAMLDFLLTFPFFLMILLVVIQFALMVNARIVVSWAAFAAARSAVVWSDEGLGVATHRAQAAAAVGCAPISPAHGLWLPNPVAALLVAHSTTGIVRRAWRVTGMHGYATSATTVKITDDEASETHGETSELGPHDPVTVTVTHQFHLAVPYADGLFSRAFGGWLLGLPVVPIRESYTLSNEGKVRTEGEDPPPCLYCDLSVRSLIDLVRRVF